MEQWHKAMPHKAFSDLKYGTEHGTMAQIYGTTKNPNYKTRPTTPPRAF
ncbi:hypothetical protein ACTHSI_00585 [Neisseria sp. P0001.S004]